MGPGHPAWNRGRRDWELGEWRQNIQTSFRKCGYERRVISGSGIKKNDLRLGEGFILFGLFNGAKFIYTKEHNIHTQFKE